MVGKELNRVKIPDRGKCNIIIVPELWYVIYEQNLLKPKVLNKSFVNEYFAVKFCLHKMPNKRYNILKGETLLKFGITLVQKKLTDLVDTQAIGNYKYSFHQGLTRSKKKVLRTQYRRTLRRKLLRLLDKRYK